MYMLEVLDTTLTRTALLTPKALFKFQMDIELNAVSAMAFTVRADLDVTIDRDYFINVWRGDVLQRSFLVVKKVYYYDGPEYLTVGCASLEVLLSRRIIYPSDDPSAAGGYSTKAGYAESVMHAYVDDQCISASTTRVIPSLTLGDNWARGGDDTGIRARHENLLELLQTIAKKSQVDFSLLLLEGVIYFLTDIYGRARTADGDNANFYMVSVERGNMINPQLELNYRDTKNFCFALGVGEGEFRDILEVSTTDTQETPYSRSEFVTEAGNAEVGSNLEVLTQADAALMENRPKRSIAYELPAGIYLTDLILGDRVSVRYRDFNGSARLTKISVEFTQGLEKITPTLEEE